MYIVLVAVCQPLLKFYLIGLFSGLIVFCSGPVKWTAGGYC